MSSTEPRTRRSRADVAFAAAAALVVAVHVALIVAGLAVAPIGFDEAYVVQAPWNLVTAGQYGTFDWQHDGANRVFDTLLSSGPVALLPIALSFALFGVGIVQVRLAMIPFTVLLVVCAFLFGRRVGGRWVGLAAALGIAALNLRADLPRSAIWSTVDGLGEIPTVALLLLAMLLLTRSRVLAGLAFGLAALCKVVILLASPALALAVLLIPVPEGRRPWRFRLIGVIVLAAFTAIPSAVYELVKLVTLGWPDYLVNLKAYLSFILSSGSGLDQAGSRDIVGRAVYLAQAWFVPWPLAVVALVAGLTLAVVWVLQRVRNRPWDRAARGTLVLFVAGAGVVTLMLVWWVAFSNSIFARHVFPGLLLVPVVLLSFGGAVVLPWLRDDRKGVRIGAGALVVAAVGLLGWQTALSVQQAYSPGPWTRAGQEAAASFIASEVGSVQHIGYWSNPELRLLGANDTHPYPFGDGPLVLSPQLELMAPGLYERARDACEDVLYDADGFVVCSVDPDSEVVLDWNQP